MTLDLDSLECMARALPELQHSADVLALVAVARAAKVWQAASDHDAASRDALLDALNEDAEGVEDHSELGDIADAAQCAADTAAAELRAALRAAGLCT